jgi:Carboxypeptidase regulatory-like domain/TonB dependent receptor
MKLIHLLVCTIVGLLLAGSAAHAQGVGASGNITGTVSDQTGALVPKANITAVETARGTRYAAVTDSSGEYRLTGVPPSTYVVTAQTAGFQTEIQRGVIVNVGETAIVDFHLKLAAAGQTVEVTAEPPVVETERGSQANTINQQYIDNLPIDRRDYLTFTLLLPGVADSTRLADDQDFRVKQTPQSGLSFYGSNGRGNSITIDGGEAQDDAGGVRLTLGQDGVQEFQVNRSNYTAALGGASGASINIVSKSGTNDLHGTLYGFFRNDALDARDPFAFTQALAPGAGFDPAAPDSAGAPVKDSLQRYQFGGTVSFPVKRDKSFLFLSFDGLRQDAQNAVPLLTNTGIFRTTGAQNSIFGALAAEGNAPVPCINKPDGTVMTLPAAICAFGLQSLLTINANPNALQQLFVSPGQAAINGFLVNQFEANGGLFNYNTRQYLFSGRFDHHFNDENVVSATYRYGHSLLENPDVQSLTGFSAGSSIHNYDNNAQVAWIHQFSSRTQNELRLQFDYNSFNVIPNEPGEVGLQIPGFANNLGTNIFLPSLSILRRYEFADNVTLTRANHTIGFGGSELLRGNHTESHTFLPGRFVFGSLPGAALSACFLPSATANPCGVATAGANIDSLQAASLGQPVVYQQGFGLADYPAYTRPLTGLYLQDSWKVTPTFTLNYGVRYEIDTQYNPLNTYYGDVGPRISFAWDPLQDHKTVIRGGYGIFYGPIDAQIPAVDLSLGVLNRNRTTVENQHNKSQVPDQVNNVVGTCGVSFGPLPIVPPGGNSPCTRFISIYVDPITPTPFAPALKTSAQLFQGLFNPAGNPSGTNLIACTTPAPGSSACITPADVAAFGIFAANNGPLSPLTVLFSNPPNYKPPYSQQASIGIEREIAPGFSVAVSGIYSHTLRLPVAIDTNLLPTTPTTSVTLANGKTTTYKNWNIQAATDPLFGLEGLPCAPAGAGCFVNPLIIQNNQYTDAASALYEGLILEVKKRFSDNFTLFGNYTFSKAFDTSTDYNTDYGPQDPTNLGLDRSLSEFDERHKVEIAGIFDSPWKGPILSGFELAPIFSYHSGHPFNLLAGTEVNGDNHTTNERPIGAPRDSGLGPNYYDFDMRLSWQHRLGERVSVRFTAEGFNIANRTNFASVNNEVSPLFGLPAAVGGEGNATFNVHGIRPGTALADGTVATPSTPLAFTSALPKREIQLGVRFLF